MMKTERTDALSAAARPSGSKMFDDQEYNARLTEGYLLSASSEETWNTVADILRPVLWKG